MSDLAIIFLCILGWIVMGNVTIVIFKLFYCGHLRGESPDPIWEFREYKDIILVVILWPGFLLVGSLYTVMLSIELTAKWFKRRRNGRRSALKKIADFYPNLINHIPNIIKRG